MKDRTTSTKSRAGRRAQSPSLGVDGNAKTQSDEWQDISQPDLSVLSARSGAGVTKKSTKGQKRMSRAQRLRKEKGMAMADAVVDKLEKKVIGSKRRGKVVKERAAAWEDVNSGSGKLSRKERRLAQLQEDFKSKKTDARGANGDSMEIDADVAALITKGQTDGPTAVELAEVDMIA